MNFNQDGIISSIGSTVKGKSNGVWYYFNDAGDMIEKKNYNNGQVQK
ncbi:hypothetical protein ACG2LH_07125 [Zhouia sp. PK063]